ncbi:hypothetical protein ES708_20859 [subsurface metagenome]
MLKPDAKTLHIKEQIIDDLVTGITLIFQATPSGEARLHLLGDALPLGNRDFQFDVNGKLVGTGSRVDYCDGRD